MTGRIPTAVTTGSSILPEEAAARGPDGSVAYADRAHQTVQRSQAAAALEDAVRRGASVREVCRSVLLASLTCDGKAAPSVGPHGQTLSHSTRSRPCPSCQVVAGPRRSWGTSCPASSSLACQQGTSRTAVPTTSKLLRREAGNEQAGRGEPGEQNRAGPPLVVIELHICLPGRERWSSSC